MNDEFLKYYRQSPRADFARQLHEKIDGGTNMVKPNTWRRTLTRWSPALLAAMIVLAIALVVALPPARALAQDFLDLFRVKKFAAIQIDPARVQQLENLNLDTEKLFADNVQVLQEPGKPVTVASVEEAGQRAGFNVAVPLQLPNGAKLQVSVQGAGAGVLTANVSKVQELLNLVGIDDAQIPQQLDGAKITIRKPAAVLQKYTFKNGAIEFMQSPSPEVELPPGVELKQLAEIGLRVLGLSKNEAHNFADKIDWSSTFLIPIPANAAEVRQVSVNGADGLMLTSNGTARNGRSPYANGEAMILWAKGDMVYALHGYGSAVNLLEIANSVK
jgi:hypothetical protein